MASGGPGVICYDLAFTPVSGTANAATGPAAQPGATVEVTVGPTAGCAAPFTDASTSTKTSTTGNANDNDVYVNFIGELWPEGAVRATPHGVARAFPRCGRVLAGPIAGAQPPLATRGRALTRGTAGKKSRREDANLSVTDRSTHVIVGAGLAGAKAAETLRAEGFDGRLMLVGDEAERPYERPPLSKEYLRGEASEKPYVHDERYYAENEIELELRSHVSEIDPAASEIVIGDRRLAYSSLLLATGAAPRRLAVPGSDLDGVHYLRDLSDSERIGERIERGQRLVVVGSGWIGAEIAASAREKGCEVTMIEMSSLPLERVLGPEVGQHLPRPPPLPRGRVPARDHG